MFIWAVFCSVFFSPSCSLFFGHARRHDGHAEVGTGGHAEAGYEHSGHAGDSPFSPTIICSFITAFGGFGLIFSAYRRHQECLGQRASFPLGRVDHRRRRSSGSLPPFFTARKAPANRTSGSLVGRTATVIYADSAGGCREKSPTCRAAPATPPRRASKTARPSATARPSRSPAWPNRSFSSRHFRHQPSTPHNHKGTQCIPPCSPFLTLTSPRRRRCPGRRRHCSCHLSSSWPSGPAVTPRSAPTRSWSSPAASTDLSKPDGTVQTRGFRIVKGGGTFVMPGR